MYQHLADNKQFQHTAARRRLARHPMHGFQARFVSTHSRPKAAGLRLCVCSLPVPSFNTQPPEGGWHSHLYNGVGCQVSTHSRPKAAGSADGSSVSSVRRFNTQPPEGGWYQWPRLPLLAATFQHTAARRRLAKRSRRMTTQVQVSTHSRPKAAGKQSVNLQQ